MNSCNNFEIQKKDEGLNVIVVSTDWIYAQFSSEISRRCLSPGIYFYSLKTSNFKQIYKMVLIK